MTCRRAARELFRGKKGVGHSLEALGSVKVTKRLHELLRFMRTALF